MDSPAITIMRRLRLAPLLFHCGPRQPTFVLTAVFRRHLATHRETPASSLLSGPLDRAASREGLSGNSRLDTLGPFPLGMRPNPASQVKLKPWSELNARGKVARGTARTTNLTVIIIGGVFTCVLAYALATELFAKNSPTRLYDDACQKLGASPEVSKYLKHPLKFHINAPSVNAPRHRNRHVSSQLAVDQAGQEHLLLHFYVESIPSAPDSKPESTPSLNDITFSSAYEWARMQGHDFVDSSKRAFAYVVGLQTSPQENPSLPNHKPAPTGVRYTNIGQTSSDTSAAWSFAGLFSGLRSSAKQAAPETGTVQHAGEWTEGEVHADLVKDEKGDFKYRYLLVDIPHSRTRKALRVYVEKGQGFREGEGVFMWG